MSDLSPVIFDGHNDVLSGIFCAGGMSAASTFLEGRQGAIDAVKMRAGGFGGGFFAIYVPSSASSDFRQQEMTKPRYDLPLSEPVDRTGRLSG
ncbi:MAG: peptidase M19, partial [Pseudomonadota bacterium]